MKSERLHLDGWLRLWIVCVCLLIAHCVVIDWLVETATLNWLVRNNISHHGSALHSYVQLLSVLVPVVICFIGSLGLVLRLAPLKWTAILGSYLPGYWLWSSHQMDRNMIGADLYLAGIWHFYLFLILLAWYLFLLWTDWKVMMRANQMEPSHLCAPPQSQN